MTAARTYFNQVAEDYGLRSQTGIWSYLRLCESRGVLEFIGDIAGQEALELGCGTGYYSEKLIQLKAAQVTCVDFSEAMLEQIRLPRCEKIVADIETFQSVKTYNLILCAGALEFLDRPDKVFISSAKMLSPNGRMVVLFPRKSLWGRFYQVFHHSHRVNVRTFEIAEMEQMVLTAGLKILRRKDIFPFTTIAEIGCL